jgi:hypothetical protein
MSDGKYAKSFQNKLKNSTNFCENNFVYCRKHEYHDNFVFKDGIGLFNDYVVLYNRKLLMQYNAHINVEICCQSLLIKYLFKYASKELDRCRMVLQNETNDEIHAYRNCRFICSYEDV